MHDFLREMGHRIVFLRFLQIFEDDTIILG